MSVAKSEDYEEAINKAVEKSFSKTAKVARLNAGKEQTGVIETTVNIFQEGKTVQRVTMSRDGSYWVAKTI